MGIPLQRDDKMLETGIFSKLRNFVTMKTLVCITLIATAIGASAQTIVGKWQLSEQKTCFQANVASEAERAEMKESDTEKELSSAMSSSSATAVARVMELKDDGKGEEGIFSAGKKKASSKTAFRYQVSDEEFYILDKKSGVVTQRWIIDELTETSLKMHDAARECETKAYIKAK